MKSYRLISLLLFFMIFCTMILGSEPSFAKEDGHTKSFVYSENKVLEGTMPSDSYYFDVPDYWKIKKCTAKLRIKVSELIKDVPASLTFYVNDHPIKSVKVSYKKGGAVQDVSVDIPSGQLRTGFNEFRAEGYVRLYDDKGCIDNLSGANWMEIKKNSAIVASYDAKAYAEKISDYPYPFASTMNETGRNMKLYVPEKAENEELEAALMLRADLAKSFNDTDQVTVDNLRSYNERERAAAKVIIGLYSRLGKAKTLLDKAIKANVSKLDDHGVVCATKDASGTPVLIVSSADQACLHEAAALLMDEDRISQENTGVAFVKKGASKQVAENIEKEASKNEYTLKDLTDQGLEFTGAFHQEKEISLPFSGEYTLAESGKINLHFRYGENLDFTRSLVTVYWGSTPIGSKKLKKENAGDDQMEIAIPKDMEGNPAGSIKIAFDLELQDLYCTPRQDQTPWAYVAEDSQFYLPVGDSARLSLKERPYPFVSYGTYNKLLIVFPDAMDKKELALAGQVMSAFGTVQSPYGSFQVIKASDFSKKHHDSNIIAIGTFKDNAFIKKMNDSLPFPYDDSGVRFLGNEQVVLSENLADGLGTMQLIVSPYSEKRAVLAVCGTAEKNLDYIETFLESDKNREKLEKDAVLFTSASQCKTYEFIKTGLKSAEKPSLKSYAQENKQSVLFLIISISVLLLLLIAVILVLLRLRINKSKEEQD